MMKKRCRRKCIAAHLYSFTNLLWSLSHPWGTRNPFEFL